MPVLPAPGAVTSLSLDPEAIVLLSCSLIHARRQCDIGDDRARSAPGLSELRGELERAPQIPQLSWKWLVAEETTNGTDLPDEVQRPTAKGWVALALSILRGGTPVQEAARKHDLTVAEIEEWKDGFLLGADNALRSRPKDEDAFKEGQIKKLQRKAGRLGRSTGPAAFAGDGPGTQHIKT